MVGNKAIWRELPDYPGYWVSDVGDLVKDDVRQPATFKAGYTYFYDLVKDGTTKRIAVSALMLSAFPEMELAKSGYAYYESEERIKELAEQDA